SRSVSSHLPTLTFSLYFHSLLNPTLETSSKLASVLRTFFITVGVDTELCFMRTLGYIITKLHMIKELSVGLGLKTLFPSPIFSYVTKAQCLWIMKGYSTVMNMKPPPK
ncbi:hypothetical protein V8G54_006510, partial [Vigna mungo]